MCTRSSIVGCHLICGTSSSCLLTARLSSCIAWWCVVLQLLIYTISCNVVSTHLRHVQLLPADGEAVQLHHIVVRVFPADQQRRVQQVQVRRQRHVPQQQRAAALDAAEAQRKGVLYDTRVRQLQQEMLRVRWVECVRTVSGLGYVVPLSTPLAHSLPVSTMTYPQAAGTAKDRLDGRTRCDKV